MGKLDGKYAVVTGAAKGIGAAIARKYLAEGAAKVALLDLTPIDPLSFDESGERAFAYVCDIGSEESVREVFAKIYEDFGRIDILVNNAGITRDAMFHKMSTEQWKAVLNVDLFSVFYTCRQVINPMRQQNYGRIINIASSSIRGNIGQCNYAAAKSGIVGFTCSLAKESGRKGITVNCIAPGGTNTDMYKTVPQEVLEATLKRLPFGRLAEPEEIAGTAAFLASDDASYVSGQVIFVTGGNLS